MAGRERAFSVDEAPLRNWALKAYQENRSKTGKPKRAIDAVRQFLSGPPGGKTVLGSYWFEEDAEASVKSFTVDLEKAAPGLAREAIEPLLKAVKQMEAKGARELAPSLGVYISSLAGALAVKSGLDETISSAVLAAALIGLSRAGKAPFEKALEKPQKKN